MTVLLSDKHLSFRNNLPIGVLDSGIGGLTIAHEIAKILPYESIIYHADVAHLPYGEKSAQEIIQHTNDGIAYLEAQGVKMILLACHTASVYYPQLVQRAIPVLNMYTNTIQEVRRICRGSLGILGTTATIRSHAYQAALEKHFLLTPVACPKLVPLVENHETDVMPVLKEYLAPLKEAQVDSVLLACTHYHYLQTAIQEEMGSCVAVLDTSASFATYVSLYLQRHQLEAKGVTSKGPQPAMV